MSKQLNVSLAFTAKTNEAIAQIKQLQRELNNISLGKFGNDSPIKTLTPEIQSAMKSAAQLQAALEGAVNVRTGKLDLSKFSETLDKNQIKLSDYAKQLSVLGPVGNKTFLQLAQSISQAETPLIRTGLLLKEFGTTLANTARWQLSSSILHGFIGSVQSAYGYAQDLNESLNNIRIVTGQNTDQMSKFAVEANRAAKALSTTTTKYTNASLIYYQQGLSDSEVKQRTDITIKMANVARQNAEIVSDQMTAVWNNFYDGSKSLEYYADVMTALGAATASSTDEISDGLNKFAAVANTVGLSYEYAASALATLTSNTRESADVVGNALKTLFARIQGLQLGETLDDGTTMNKYSEALDKVGISIYDTNGELKAMDKILTEMASKWDTLSSVQQVALAQTVAGVRQYNQLVALMENWDNGDADSMVANLNTSRDATGALNQQAEIYAESWEAASKRVTASLERIYGSLLNDEFFIDLTNFSADLLDTIGNIIEAFGGVKGILLIIGSLVTKIFHDEISTAMNNFAYNIKRLTPSGRQAEQKKKEEAWAATAQLKSGTTGNEHIIETKSLEQEVSLQKKLLENAENLSKSEIKQYQIRMDTVRAIQDQAKEQAKVADESKKNLETLKDTMRLRAKIQASTETRQREEEEARRQSESDRDTVRAQHLAEQQALRERLEGEIRTRAEEDFKKNFKRTDENGNKRRLTKKKVTDAGNSAVLEAQDSINEEIANLALMQEVEYRGIVDQRLAQARNRISEEVRKAVEQAGKDIDSHTAAVSELGKTIGITQRMSSKASEQATKNLGQKDTQEVAKNTIKDLQLLKNQLKELSNQRSLNIISDEEIQEITLLEQNLQTLLDDPNSDAQKLKDKLGEIANKIVDVRMATEATIASSAADADNNSSVQISSEEYMTIARMAAEAEEAQSNFNESMDAGSSMAEELGNDIDLAGQQTLGLADKITYGAQAIMNFGMILSSVQGIVDTALDPNLSGMEKAIAIMTSLGTVIAIVGTALDKNNISMLKSVATSIATSLGFDKVAFSATLAAGGVSALWATLWPIALAMGAVALTIWGLVSAFDAIKAASPEGQLESAKESAEELNSVLEDAKQASEALKSAFNSYDSVVEALENCTEGTQEWRDALREVNNEVLGLLSDYPELSTMVHPTTGEKAVNYGKNGELVVADWAKEQLLGNANKAVTNAQAASILANQKVRNAQVNLDRSDLAKQINEQSGTYGHIINTNVGYGANASTPKTQDVSSAIAQYISDHASDLSSMTPEDQKKMLQVYFDDNGIAANVDAWVSAISELGPEIGQLAKTVEANTAAVQIENEAIAGNVLANEQAVQTSEWTKEIVKISAEDLDKSIETHIADLKNKGWGTNDIAQIDGVNAKAREIFEEYAKAAGITDYDLTDTTGNDQNRAFVYTDSTGQEVTVSLHAMRSVVAAARANEELAANANQLVKTLSSKTDEEVAAITAAVTKDVENLTVGQTNGEYDITALANTLSAADLNAMGYEGELDAMRASYINDYNALAKDAPAALTDVINDYVDNVQASMNSLMKSGYLSKLTIAEADSFGAILEQTFINNGSEGMNVVSEMFKKAANSGFEDEFINALRGIDWTSVTPESLQESLQSAGVAANFGADELKNLINVMNQGGNDFKATAEKYKTVQEIIDSLKSGKSITEEQLKTLDAGMEKYFLQMADGTYKLIDDAETFYKMVNEQQVEGFQKTVDEKEADNKAINNVLDYDINDLMQNDNGGDYRRSSSGGSSSGAKLAPTRMNKHIYTGNDRYIVDSNTATAQLDLLEQTGYTDQAQINQWREDLEEGKLDVEALTLAVKEWVEQNGGAEEIQKRLTEQIITNNAEIQKNKESIASTAMSVDELNDMLTQGKIDIEQYDKALNNAFQQEILEEDFDLEELSNYAEALLESREVLVETREEAYRLAIAHAKMERGIDTLTDSWDSWNDIMKNGNESQKLQTLHEMKEVMSDIIGVDIKEISDDFVNSSEAMSLMQEAANGNIKALDKLSELFTRQYIADVKINNTEFKGDLQTLQNDLLEMMSQFQLEDIEIGTSLDSSGFAKDMTEMMAAAGADVETINKILAGMGFEPEVHYVEIPFEQYNQMRDQQITDWEDGGKSYTAILDSNLQTEANGKFRVPVINGSKTTFKGSASSAASNKAKKSKGSSSKPKKAKKVDKSDVVKRYKEVDDLLDDLNDKMEDTSKLADRLYGKARLNQMQKHNNLLKQEIELTKQKKQEAIKYLDEDRKALFEAASEAGTMIEIDKNGLISNYTEAMTKLYEQLDAEIASANADGNATEKEQERIDKFQDRIDALQSAIDQYDDTRELIEDLDNDLDEKFYEWQDNNYEMLTYELEIKLELNEDDLKIIDYYLNKISDDFYKMAEAAALMVGNNGVNQLTAYTDNLSNYKDYVDSLTTAYAEGGPDSEISQENYIKGLREAQDGILSNLESLNDLDETMMHYYGDTLDMAMDEISKYIDHMDHLTEVLDHYQSLMEVLGKETDYETMGIILEGKAKTLENQAKVAKATMEMYKGEAEDRYQAYQQALLDGDQAAAELYLQQYEDALAAADEAEEDYLSRAEEWANALRAVLENKLSGFNQTLENALTGGTSFDQMTTAMERAASLQEEYLTTTNKIYETNKLMRQAQQEIDKTSNSVAKQRLKNFIEETNELQDQTKLSNYELEIQKAKYDLLLAEIALEEAQNAKSIVRLQRDNEGNFGYVYTADSDAINNAEQEMLDKQNDLYNIALEGANDYNEKYQQTLNEMYDTLTDLQEQYLEGAFESEEEYHAAMEAAKEYYYEKLKQYSELHAIALVTDSRVINDAWSSDFNDMIQNTETWKDKVNEYVGNVTVAFDEWKSEIDSIIQDTGLDEIADKVGNIVSESEQLKETLIGEDGDGGIVGAINLEIEAVKDVTEQYATLRGQLEEVRTAYEDIATAIGEVIKAQSEAANSKTPTVTPYDPQQGGSQTPKDTDTSGDGKGNLGGGSICPKCGKEKSKCTCDSEPKSVTITLYSTNDARGKMGTFTVDSEEDLTIGSKTNAGGPTMYPVDGRGWHGYIEKRDRDKIREILGFATGGYTGDWSGPYGKLAFLHQKELVLNKNDTENFLASMEILERILQVIDLQSASAQIGGWLSAPGFSGNNNTLEQNVHIDAAFPNVTNSEEIEEAFNNLINLASQYAYRS